MEIPTPEIRGQLAVPHTVPMSYPFNVQARPWGDTETGSATACRLFSCFWNIFIHNTSLWGLKSVNIMILS